MAQRLKEQLKQKHLIRVFCVGHLFHPKLIELVGMHGHYDGLWLDQEHPGLTLERLDEGCRAARACGLDTFVRLPATDYAAVMRPLEIGAGGIMASQVHNARETEQIVQWAKFHPRGIRGINSTGYEGRYGTVGLADYLKQANEQTFVAIQIENMDAVEDVERIAAVPDVDLLFVGPADLSQSMGLPGAWDHPRHWQAVERVARAAHANGIAWATLPLTTEYARRSVELGCRMLSLGIDAWFVHRGLMAFQAEYAEYFPTT